MREDLSSSPDPLPPSDEAPLGQAPLSEKDVSNIIYKNGDVIKLETTSFGEVIAIHQDIQRTAIAKRMGNTILSFIGKNRRPGQLKLKKIKTIERVGCIDDEIS